MKYINLSKTLPEIFEEVRNKETSQEKVSVLKLYRNTKALQFFVNSTYNVDWSSVSIPDYTPNKSPVGICFSSINNEINRIKCVLDLSKTNPQKSQLLLQRTLESVSSDEALLLVNMINGRKIDGISKAIFREVFPELFRFQNET